MELETLISECREIANQKGFHISWQNMPTYLMLVVTELSEAMEAWRDDNRKNFNEEIADTLIRLFHLIGDLGLQNEILETLIAKMEFNRQRPFLHGRKFI